MFNVFSDPRRRYRLVTFVMLAVGLGSSLVVYLTAGTPEESAMVSEFEESKRFAHDLELYGGKANVIANKFSHWFDSLWHGQSLAFTIAFLTVVVSGGYLFVASRLSAHSTDEDEGRRDGEERR